MKRSLLIVMLGLLSYFCKAQEHMIPTDTTLRIKNFSPFFSLAVDSVFSYRFIINKPQENYYWYLRKAPAGLTIDKDNGELKMRVSKSLFMSGRLKFDLEYKVQLAVQNLNEPEDRYDTSFTITFYNTEIIPSRVNPTVAGLINADEGDTIRFTINCTEGNFPIESLSFSSNYPITSATPVEHCGDVFTWIIPFDFIKEKDSEKSKQVQLFITGRNKFHAIDTARIQLLVKENINYPLMLQEYAQVQADIDKYITQLKASFMSMDKKVKRTKSTRTTFELATAASALGGTVFSSMSSESQKTAGKILPSVGVTLVPVKEATTPNNPAEQNMATLTRSSIKRLEYLLVENRVVGERDPEIVAKTRKLRSELTQTQIQLIDIPIVPVEQDLKKLDTYFNNPKVNKKYRLKKQ